MSKPISAVKVALMRHASLFIEPESAAESMRELCDSHEALRQALEKLSDWLKGERIPAGTVNPDYADTIADNAINRVQTKLAALLPSQERTTGEQS